MNIAIIFAGGVGIRMGEAAIPKQFLRVNDIPIIIHTLRLFQHHEKIDKIYISMVSSHVDYMQSLVEQYGISKVCAIVPGGETGQDSIYNALRRAADENEGDSIVLIHDGVRPILSHEVISANIESVRQHRSAITITPCKETILQVNEAGQVEHIPARKYLHKAQAPQSFYLADILAAHDTLRNTPERYGDLVDSCSLYFKVHGPVHFVQSNLGNIKVTTPEDVYILRGLLMYRDAVLSFGVNENICMP